MKTSLTLLLCLGFLTVSHSQNNIQIQGNFTNIDQSQSFNQQLDNISNPTVVQTNEDVQNYLDNVNQVVTPQQVQVVQITNISSNPGSSRQSRSSRGNSSPTVNDITVDGNKSTSSTAISRISLPNPVLPTNITPSISLKPNGRVSRDSKEENTKRGNYVQVEKGFVRKNIWNPMKGWFKRTFHKKRSFSSGKLTCFFKD